MKNRSMCFAITGLAAGLALVIAPTTQAGSVDVVGGQTSVLLDTATLSSAASLNLSGVSSDVIVPGDLGDGSVAFGINGPSSSNPTTFSYDPADFGGSFGGAIEHSGSVFFNADAVEVGDFTIGYDGSRAGGLGGQASGFFVESTTGIPAILFDIAAPSSLGATDTELLIDADLLVSSEFAGFLQDNGLASSDLSGADVGDARVAGIASGGGTEVVPTPSAFAAGLLGVTALAARRRSKDLDDA